MQLCGVDYHHLLTYINVVGIVLICMNMFVRIQFQSTNILPSLTPSWNYLWIFNLGYLRHVTPIPRSKSNIYLGKSQFEHTISHRQCIKQLAYRDQNWILLHLRISFKSIVAVQKKRF